VLTADILIALPGGAGTLSEINLRLQYGKSVVLYLQDKTVHGLRLQDFKSSNQVIAALSIEDIQKAIA